MNWKLILCCSLFALGMSVATVYVIPSKIEWAFWLPIFIINAYLIAKNASGKYFFHGFLVSLVNCIWITAAHVLLFSSYIANHAEEAAMTATSPLHDHPRVMMLIVGPIIGIVSGLVQGLFALIASKLIKK